MAATQLESITCIIQKGEADKLIKAAQDAGAEGATIFYARGTGVREKLGLLGNFIQPEKEVVIIVSKAENTNKIFDAIVDSARLDLPGKGFAFVQKVERAIGFVTKKS